MSLTRAPAGDNTAADTSGALPKFQVQKLLGQGTFGRVYLVRECATGKLKALKRTQKWKRTASREVLCLEDCRGATGLITADSIFYSTTPGGFTVQNILMEYMTSSLQAFLSKRRKDLRATGKPPSSAPWIRHIASQIINGVHELHSRGVLHRDLKPENVLVSLCSHSLSPIALSDNLQIDEHADGTITARICDMGSSKCLTDRDEQSMPYICSRWYRAPELLLGATQYSVAVDLWSLGCLLAELLCLRPLFECESPSPPKAKAARHSSACPAEAIQLLTLVELLGSPTKQEVESLLYGCQPSTRMLARRALSRIDGVESLNVEQLLLKLCPATDTGLVQIINSLLRWRPTDRVNASVLLHHPYIKNHTEQTCHDASTPNLAH